MIENNSRRRGQLARDLRELEGAGVVFSWDLDDEQFDRPVWWIWAEHRLWRYDLDDAERYVAKLKGGPQCGTSSNPQATSTA